MAIVISNVYEFWDESGLVWTSSKNDGYYSPGVFCHMTFERASTDATAGVVKVWAWRTINVGDLPVTGTVEVKSYNTVIASGNFSATIGLEPTLLLQTNHDIPNGSDMLYGKIRFIGIGNTSIGDAIDLTKAATTPHPAITDITRTETETDWIIDVTFTGKDYARVYICCVLESGNKSVEVEEPDNASGASTPVTRSFTIPKTQLKEVLKASVGVFDDSHRAVMVQEWERVVPPLFHVSNQYERSIGIGCHAAEQPNTLKIADDMEIIGASKSEIEFSTTPVRIGPLVGTEYSVYMVVVRFEGSSLSESFTAPAEIQCLLTISGIGQISSTGYWFPIPHSSLAALNAMSSFRCTITGNSCLVEVRKGSSLSYTNDTIKAVVEFVC